VMSREQDIAVAQHTLKGLITRLPSIGFNASPAWFDIAHPNVQWHIQRVGMALAKIAPATGIRMQTMINMNGLNRRRCGGVSISSQSVEQCNAVSTTRQCHPPAWGLNHRVRKGCQVLVHGSRTGSQLPYDISLR